jgi:hypothetical protein
MRILLTAIMWHYVFRFSAGHHTHSDTRNRFKDVIFIVKYNYKPSSAVLLIHLRMWTKVFVKQVIFIPWNETEVLNFTEKNNLLGHKNLAFVSKIENETTGYVAYEVVTTVMKSHPDAVGYLFAHDDMAMNVSALMKLDQECVWQSQECQWMSHNQWKTGCRDLDVGWTSTEPDWWWARPWGKPALNKLLGNHADIAAEMNASLGSNHIWCSEQSDFFYIPHLYKDTYIRVLGAFAKHEVFLEIAIPTFIKSYIPANKVLLLPLCTFWNDSRHNIKSMEDLCGDNFPLYHPVKLSKKENVIAMVKKMALADDKKLRDDTEPWQQLGHL